MPETGTVQSTPMSARTKALAATALLIAVATATCAGGNGGGVPPTDHPSGSPTESPSAAEGTTATLPRTLTGQRLEWRKCPAPTPLQAADAEAPAPLPDGTPWECTTLEVPLDYGRPDGETIDLAVIRAKAKPEEGQPRIGSLVFNFGGPGGSGVAYLPLFASVDRDYQALHSRYDLVSFDPRGVGASAPVRCLDDKAKDEAAERIDDSPDDDAELRALIAHSEKDTAACEKNSGQVLSHVGTTNAARDMDLLRQVLGDDKLNYFGLSYGSELGGVYAHLFPERVGRAVFDAVSDPTQDAAQEHLTQTEGFQLALDHYLEDCAAKPDCPAGRTVQEGRRTIIDLLGELDGRPLPTEDGRKLTQGLALGGILLALYSEDLWPLLTDALTEAQRQRTGDLLLALADELSERDSEGRYTTLWDALGAVTCADDKDRYTVDDVRAAMPAFREASPVFGESFAWSLLSCTGWPVEGENRDPQVQAAGSAPILLVGTTGDPATPYAGTLRMADELGEGVGVVLTYEGEGHGAYGTDACVATAANRYLLDGVLPEDGTVCP